MTGKPEDPWREATKGVKPLAKGRKVATSSGPSRPLRKTRRGDTPVQDFPASGPCHQSPFDPPLYNKIAEGTVGLDFRIDLHGMTEATAFDRLCRILEGAYIEGRRRGLVITGKGREGLSPIRIALPKWLSSPKLAPLVSSFAYSAPRHGGDGAFYVLLRKRP